MKTTKCGSHKCSGRAIDGATFCAACKARRSAASSAHVAAIAIAAATPAPEFYTAAMAARSANRPCPRGCDCDVCSFVSGRPRR